MTDNQIVMLMERCYKKEESAVITQFNSDDTITKITVDDILGVINRQKAEIEQLRKTILDGDFSSITALKAKESWHMENSEYIDRLKEEIEKLRKRVNFVEQANVQLREELKETTEKFNCQQYVYADLSDIIRDKNAEIERLNKEVDRLSQIVLYHDGHIADAKSEAIKEFAEKVDKLTVHTIDDDYMVWKSKFDNLILDFTKMVGGD